MGFGYLPQRYTHRTHVHRSVYSTRSGAEMCNIRPESGGSFGVAHRSDIRDVNVDSSI